MPRGKNKWFTVYVAGFGRDWIKVAIIKSEGLVNLLLPKLKEIYPNQEIEVIPGKDAVRKAK